MRGDLDLYLDLVHHARGFILLAPTGGPASQHEDRAGELRGWESIFAGGEATYEHVVTHAWADTVILIMTERQHGRIGDQPDQDLSVRVTHVYRRVGGDWQLVHRHAAGATPEPPPSLRDPTPARWGKRRPHRHHHLGALDDHRNTGTTTDWRTDDDRDSYQRRLADELAADEGTW